MAYDQHCRPCPYFQQRHLLAASQTTRSSPPIELESHGSSTLLVFQAPGIMEWIAGKPIQPTQKRGGTAGARIQNSWHRKAKTREDFDIINAVQCFPGKGNNRDFEPMSDSRSCCAKRLKEVLEQGTYSEIIVFGDIAFKTVNSLKRESGANPQVIRAAHPNGGVSKSTLDSLW